MNSFPSLLANISDLSDQHIEGLLELSKKIKDRDDKQFVFTKRRPLLTTIFLENSTRTKLSFASSIKRLGGIYLDFPTKTSSLKKGESLEETLHTLSSQGFELCVIRTSENGIYDRFRDKPPLKIINGGDGTNEHPTQALLDVFTMNELGLNLKDKTVGIIGDVKHSRVANSLVPLIERQGGKVIYCTPESWVPANANGREITHDRDELIKKSDLLYTLRVQNERHIDGNSLSQDEYIRKYTINQDVIKKHGKNNIAIFHPGPVNIGVELQQDILRSANYKGYEQVKNSIFLRMALIAAMVQNNDKNIGLPVENENCSLQV